MSEGREQRVAIGSQWLSHKLGGVSEWLLAPFFPRGFSCMVLGLKALF